MRPTIFGIVNITEDSFSDGGRYLDSNAAIEHARQLADGGADVLDLGAAASNPDAKQVSLEKEIARLKPVADALKGDSYKISVDSFSTPVQRWSLSQNVDYLNDIHGFPDPSFYPELASSSVKLVVMHSVHPAGRAQKIDVPPVEILDRIKAFFDRRIVVLTKAGIASARLILDPGMGFFVGSNPETSLEVLRNLPALKSAFGLPLLLSVSRKSFLRGVTGHSAEKAGAATLAAELFAVEQGADYIRTHDPAALRDALAVQRALAGETPLA